MNWSALFLTLACALIAGGLFAIGLVVHSWLSLASSLPKPGDWDDAPPEIGLIRSGWARGVGACKAALALRWRRV